MAVRVPLHPARRPIAQGLSRPLSFLLAAGRRRASAGPPVSPPANGRRPCPVPVGAACRRSRPAPAARCHSGRLRPPAPSPVPVPVCLLLPVAPAVRRAARCRAAACAAGRCAPARPSCCETRMSAVFASGRFCAFLRPTHRLLPSRRSRPPRPRPPPRVSGGTAGRPRSRRCPRGSCVPAPVPLGRLSAPEIVFSSRRPASSARSRSCFTATIARCGSRRPLVCARSCRAQRPLLTLEPAPPLDRPYSPVCPHLRTARPLPGVVRRHDAAVASSNPGSHDGSCVASLGLPRLPVIRPRRVLRRRCPKTFPSPPAPTTLSSASRSPEHGRNARGMSAARLSLAAVPSSWIHRS